MGFRSKVAKACGGPGPASVCRGRRGAGSPSRNKNSGLEQNENNEAFGEPTIASTASTRSSVENDSSTSNDSSISPQAQPPRAALAKKKACRSPTLGGLSKLKIGILLYTSARLLVLAKQAKQRLYSKIEPATSQELVASIREGSAMDEEVEKLLALVRPNGRLAHFNDFTKAYVTRDFAERILRKHGSFKRAASKFEQALAWRQEHEELLTHRRFRLGSDERVMGLDREGRPMIYLCMKNQMISGSQCLEQKVITMVQAIECMPVGVEKTIHIWDLHGQHFFAADLSPSPLIKMMQSQDTYFAERLHQVVIVGMPRAAAAIKDIVWPLVPERTRAKLRFLTTEQAQEDIQASCDDEVAGRILGAMRENRDDSLSLSERQQRWLRLTPSGERVPLVPT